MPINSVKVKLKTPYGVIIESGATQFLSDAFPHAKNALLVFDENVFIKYGDYVKDCVSRENLNVSTFIYPASENGKDKKVLDKLLIVMAEMNLTKADFCVAVGGGTASDLTGLACGIFKRGIPYVNLPTTLLSMADACIGGKTAIDFLGKKNMLGIINQPELVLCDTDFLKTLPDDRIKDGFSEIIKSAIISGEKDFKVLENKTEDISLLIKNSLKLKSKIVKKDEFDLRNRRLLNLGHTFAHAIESIEDFKISHGQAVIKGIVMALTLSEKVFKKNCDKDRIVKLLDEYGLDYTENYDREKLYQIMLSDKKCEGDKINLILVKKIGKCVVYSMPCERFKELLLEY